MHDSVTLALNRLELILGKIGLIKVIEILLE
jgi:hypothetical protein